MKTEIKIEVPKGFQIDKEKSTFELIVFKPVEDEWVDWYELGEINGYYISVDSTIDIINKKHTKFNSNRNIFPTKQDAESALALAQLLQLRKRVIGDWEADWNCKINKSCIRRTENDLDRIEVYGNYHELSFPTAEMRDKFLDKYRTLIEVYFKIK